MARENLVVTTVVFNNRSYEVLRAELDRVGATVGPKALDILDLSRPNLDFTKLAPGLGVDAERATTADELTVALGRVLSERGPRLIEAVL
jgi:acetolactate synthase I/II/III large subunit